MKARFGELTLDDDRRQLLRGTQALSITPKAFDLLKMLIDSGPRAVPKSELQARLWPDSFVTDASIATLIAEIRRVLGDDARAPRFVRTVHRYGYAFSARVDEPSRPATQDASRGLRCWVIWKGRKMTLTDGENILGREPAARVSIDSARVSRRHARIVIADTHAVLEDLNSKNGTFVNGERLSAAVVLCSCDSISLGGERLTVRISNRPGTTATNLSRSW